MDERCCTCDWAEDDGQIFLYCNNTGRTIDEKTQSAMADGVLVDREGTCSKWMPMPGADWSEGDTNGQGAID